MNILLKKGRRTIVYSAGALVVIIIIAVLCFISVNAPIEEDSNSTTKIESQGNVLEEDSVTDSAQNQETESSNSESTKGDTLNSTTVETESQKNSYDDIFGEQPNVTETDNKTEDESNNQPDNKVDNDDVTVRRHIMGGRNSTLF